METHVRCPNCGSVLLVPESALGKQGRCPRCASVVRLEACAQPKEDESRPTTSPCPADEGSAHLNGSRSPLTDDAPAEPGRSKQRASKIVVAIALGLCLGILVNVVIRVPLTLWVMKRMPGDLGLLVSLFSAFLSGALAGLLTLRLGWLWGMLTQVLALLSFGAAIAVWVWVKPNGPEVEVDPQFGADMRLLLMMPTTAAIAGAVAQKYRQSISGFLRNTLTTLGVGAGCLGYAVFSLGELFFLYLAGKALFQDGAWGRALFYGLVAGPGLSLVGTLLLMGIISFGTWVFTKIQSWYARDLDPTETR